MKSITMQITPFIAGALMGLGFGIAVTRHGNWPNVGYRVLEMNPSARNLVVTGLLFLGAGFGCLFAMALRSIAQGDSDFCPAPEHRFLWQNSKLIGILVFAGLSALGVGNFISG